MSARQAPSPRHSASLDPVRLRAARVLLQWLSQKGYVREILSEFESEDASQPSARTRAAERRRVRELVYGCVRLHGRYDYLLRRLAKQAPQTPVRVALWLGLHELCELRSPQHAVVSQCVELTRALQCAHAAGFVNGVLRRVAREGPRAHFPSAQEDPLEYALSWLSHPRWLVERWAEILPPDQLLALCEANNRRPPLVLRTRAEDRERIIAAAQEREWKLLPGRWAENALVLESRVPAPRVLDELGPFVTIQDEAAQLVPTLFTNDSIRLILDLCAAPGGKAAQLAESFGPSATVVALDTQLSRMRRLLDTRRRLDLANLAPLVADGTRPPLLPGSFDAVLVDAPCSGTGVLARRHEARWRRKPSDLVELPRLQRELLNSAVELCAFGGIIVYATCSLEREENEAVVDAVLAEREDLVELQVPARVPKELVHDGRLRVWPHLHGCDGAFAAVLTRKETGS